MKTPCPKHGPYQPDPRTPNVCPHCGQDAVILEERVEAVIEAVGELAEQIAHGPDKSDDTRDRLRDALVDLIREARR